jgi:2-polyprenyl-3-methyl-5-hydroxy-6-metoxy-1,4-benzoquinol methylase
MSRAGLLESAFRHFRSRRMRLFEKTFSVTEKTRILDVGGSPQIWKFASVHPQLTIANLPAAIEYGSKEFAQVGADGCVLPFADGAFDIVFSNSVIEHVGSPANQQRFASEIARVGRRYWVQTPNKSFPIEMHVMVPLVHRLPKRWQKTVLERFNVWELVARPSEAQRQFFVEHFLNDLRLLNASDLRALFPGSRVISERMLGLPKSLIALRA